MNPERSTVGESALSFLNIVERGGTEEWKTLHARCRDPAVAAQLGAVLRMISPELAGSARLWKYLLEELHHDLRIDLPDAEGETPNSAPDLSRMGRFRKQARGKRHDRESVRRSIRRGRKRDDA